ncbi:MAG TPA: toprim domain-containing protein, partial [Trebonia sp.]|nr:toprim domain-containing protein [Trebonia sp.]
AREFLKERGFDESVAATYGCGFAPGSWDALTKHLMQAGFTAAELTTAGLARPSQRGSLIDRFHRRLLWPIRDLSGDVVGFGARRLFDDDVVEAKYLNTPETPIYKKSQLLYGVDLAKKEIAREHRAVVVEGYTDVMACHLSGVPTAVATCGTSFGEDHVKVLRRLVMDTEGSDSEVIFTFDGDAAGRKAAIRAFSLEEKFATQTFVAVQPDGLDPCDLRLKHGEAAVRDLVARRVPLFEFAIRGALSRHNLDTSEGQLAALDEAAPIVGRIKDVGLRQRYAVNLDRWLGLMNERFVLQRVRDASRKAGQRSGTASRARSGQEIPDRRQPDGGQESPASTGGQAAVEERYNRSDPVLQVEREALKLAVQVPALAGPAFDDIAAEAFSVPAHQRLAGLMARCGGARAAGPPRDWTARLIEEAADDRVRAFLRELALEQVQVVGDIDAAYVEMVLAKVAELAVGRQITVAKARLQRMSPVDEQAEYGKLFGDLMELEQRRQALLRRATGG